MEFNTSGKIPLAYYFPVWSYSIFLASYKMDALTIKVVSVFQENNERVVPKIQNATIYAVYANFVLQH